jgi:cell shape-determining protein MreD
LLFISIFTMIISEIVYGIIDGVCWDVLYENLKKIIALSTLIIRIDNDFKNGI